MVVFLTILTAAGALYVVLPWVLLRLMRRRMERRIADRGAICLTFDDGPDPQSTPAVLSALHAAGVKATFFLRGRQVEHHAPTAAAIAAEGHEIGEHGYDHLNAWKSGPVASVVDLIRGGRAVAPYLRPGRTRLVRPPYGKVTILTLLWCLATRRVIVPWNVDPRDYAAECPEQVARHVQSRLRPGAVVLFHDGRVRPESSPYRVTTEALARVLETDTGRFATVGEALGRPPVAEEPAAPVMAGPVGGAGGKAYTRR